MIMIIIMMIMIIIIIMITITITITIINKMQVFARHPYSTPLRQRQRGAHAVVVGTQRRAQLQPELELIQVVLA